LKARRGRRVRAHVEYLLDAGILQEDLVVPSERVATIDDAIRFYVGKVSPSTIDRCDLGYPGFVVTAGSGTLSGRRVDHRMLEQLDDCHK